MDKKKLQDIFMDFLTEKNVPMFTINDEVFVNKKGALSAIIASINETLQEGDINGTKLNEDNMSKYMEANKMIYELLMNPKEFAINYSSNWSFAMTTITCENFGFDVENAKNKIKKSNKEWFEKFISLIDFLEISSTMNPTEIVVSFAVNDIWSE